MQNLKKTRRANQELWGRPIFGSKNGPFAPKGIFVGKSLILFSSTYWSISLCKILIFFTIDPELWGYLIFGPKWATLPNPKYFQKPVDKPSSFHSCLSATFQNSKSDYQSINEILTIQEYWNLSGWEPFLDIIAWEPEFWQVCSLCRMLKDHKSFRFTTIPDKTKTWFS